MLKSIFYARFHPEKGSTVLHQVPEGSVIPCPPSPTAQSPLFDYKSISDYIIPRREFCDRLVCICPPSSPRYRIVGFPVCIHDDAKYQRNDFIFNFCLVLDEEAPYAAYASVIRKLARLLRNLEEQGGFLSEEEEREGVVLAGEVGYGGGSKVYALCEMILEDLNNYCECMIPIDESNTVNLKLFPTRSPPPPIHTWHVPLSLVRFEYLQTGSWDLTVQRIIPHIDGINSVARIASLADTDTSLTRRAIAHLLYYGCICLLDIFQFSAVYAPTAEIAVFFADTNMQDECRRYVVSPTSPFGKQSLPAATATPTPAPLVPSTTMSRSPILARAGSRLNPANHTIPPSYSSTHVASNTTSQPIPPSNATTGSNSAGPTDDAIASGSEIPSRARIIEIYASLKQGLPLRDWCLQHSHLLAGIDIRRLITFAKIKGFIYRSHKYAIALKPSLDDDLEGGYTAERLASVNAAAGGDAGTRTPGRGTNGDGAAAEDTDDPIANARRYEKAWRKAAMSSGWSNPLPVDPRKGSSAILNLSAEATAASTPQGGDATPATAIAAHDGNGHGHGGTPRNGDRSGHATPPTNQNGGAADMNNTVGIGHRGEAEAVGGGGIEIGDAAMARYLDGLHCLDEICTDLKVAEREVSRRIKKAVGNDGVAFVYR